MLLIGLLACLDYGFKRGENAEPQGGRDSSYELEHSDEPGDSEPQTDDSSVEGDDIGCADGEREGFLDQGRYPDIAACSGAWSEPGVTREDMKPTCDRGAGDDADAEGSGCSAVDICAPGWSICEGWEVEVKAGSCDDAVPDGTPDKSLLFAVSQHSDDGTVCDDSTSNANDVFGCGNLGHTLSSDKNCGVLNRALASTSPDSCGYNEAEPGHGPWECDGGGDSHYHEGELVTKDGCPGWSCSYDGNAVGSSDKGGVLCCKG